MLLFSEPTIREGIELSVEKRKGGARINWLPHPPPYLNRKHVYIKSMFTLVLPGLWAM
jgi:hypothetical protein